MINSEIRMTDAKQQLVKVAQEFLAEGERVELIFAHHKVKVTSLGYGDDQCPDLVVADYHGRAFVFDPSELIAIESRPGVDGVVVMDP